MLASGSAVIQASVEKIFEFVIDPNEYPKADTKITKMEVVERDIKEMRISTRGYVRFPFLQSSLMLRVKLHPYERIEIESEPGSVSFPGSLVLDQFKAEFLFEKTEAGIRTTHVEHYVTKDSFLGRLADRLGASWLKQHMEEIEMLRLKRLVEAQV